MDAREKSLLPIAVESLASGQEALRFIRTSSQLHPIDRVGEALISWPNITVPAWEYQPRPTIMLAALRMRPSPRDERIEALRRREEEVGILSLVVFLICRTALSHVRLLGRSEIWQSSHHGGVG